MSGLSSFVFSVYFCVAQPISGLQNFLACPLLQKKISGLSSGQSL